MFNTDTTVPDWEKSPENHTENQENAELTRRAQAWNEAFPNNGAENPWLTADMETPKAPQTTSNEVAPLDDEIPTMTAPEELMSQEDSSFENPIDQPMGVEPNPSQESEAPNQLNSTDNIVANQMQQVWNNGNGGQTLNSAYDELRGSFTAENIQTSAESIEPEIATTIRENESKGVSSEANLALDNNLNPETPSISSHQQDQADLYNLTASAGAAALGAQASAEVAMNELQQNNDENAAEAAKRDLEDAQRTLEDIQSEIPIITSQLHDDPLAESTAESTVRDAQKMIDNAQESLQAAQDAAIERQEVIEENKEAVENLQEQGVQMEEINQTIDKTGGIEELQENASSEPEDEEPRFSIFG